MPEQDSDVLEVLIGKMGKDRDVERGYGGAASHDQDQRAQAISLFIADMLVRSAS
jgi:hypothetical protein